VADAAVPAQPVAFYRFYLLQADDHVARRREDYFTNDAMAMVAAKRVIGDYPGVEIWCGPRKVVTLSREEVARLRPMPHRAALLISRNKRLLQQAAAARRRTEALRARLTAQGQALAQYRLILRRCPISRIG